MSGKEAKRAAVDAALAVADDVAAGRLPTSQIEDAAAEAVRELAGTVVGEGDPAWPVQIDICRQVLALGGVPADELSEWLAVTRAAEESAAEAVEAESAPSGPSWIERALAQLGDDGEDG